MTLLRRVVAVLFGVMLFADSMPAFAQAAATITITSPESLARTDGNGNPVAKRVNDTPEGISLTDCTADQQLILPVVLGSAPAGGHLEVWAGPHGQDCTQPTSRAGATVTCTQLETNLPLVSSSLSVPVRAIAAATAIGTPADASICGAVELTSADVFVMIVSGLDALASAEVSVPIDTIGNLAPQVVVDQEDGTVHVSMTPDPSSTTTEFAVYCAAADATDAGTCSGSAISYMGAAPDVDFDARYRCVTLVTNMPPYFAYVKTLPDGTLFTAGTNVAVRVSSVDAFGNIGPLSAPQCAVAEDVPDVGDPTKCSTTPGRRAPVGAAALLVAIGAVLAARRRER